MQIAGVSLTERFFLIRPPRALLRAVSSLRWALARARSGIVPVNADIIDRTFAIIEARALGLAAEFDLAEHLAAQPCSTANLALKAGCNEDALDRLLHLLASTGCFRRTRDGRWTNTRTSSALRASHPLSMRAWARFFAGSVHSTIWAQAEHSLRTGEGATKAATGHEFFDWTTRIDPESGKLFNGAMLEGSRFLAASFAHVVDLHGAKVIADIGGGTGKLLATVLAQHPRMHGVLYDLPEVVAEAAETLRAVEDRVTVVAGSFFETVPEGADRHVLVSVLHDWDDARASSILGHCHRALPPDGKVLVVEQVVEPDGPMLFERHTDFLMLVLTGAGRERTLAHFTDLFAGAGFYIDRTWQLASTQTVFELSPR